jgi:ribonuclease Z
VECILLGSGGMMPMPHRLLASMAVRLNGRVYLFDAGEGTQLGWKKVRLGVRGFKLLAVTHLHADHCLGIPGLMMLRAQMEDPDPFIILGPPGIEEFVQQNIRMLEFHLNYPLSFVEWSEDATELAYEDDQVRIFWQVLKHTRFCLGYRLEELERPGRFDPDRAKVLGVPAGPMWGRLQKGESVTKENGETVRSDQVLGPTRRGRHVAFVVDTRPAKGIYRLCRDADIAFMEGMFLPEDAHHAEEKAHMTVLEAANIASRAGVAQVVLIHVSPRYRDEDLPSLESAARGKFENAKVGRDFEIFKVHLPE